MSKTELIQVKISPQIKDFLEQKAKQKGLTLSAYIRMVLIEMSQRE